MEKKEYWEQTLDLRRLILLVGRRLWLVITGIVLGAVIGAGVYLVITQIMDGKPAYRMSSDYYIRFNFGEFEHGDDHYNAYTWDGILRDDPIVEYALGLLPPKVTRQQVEEAVQGEMLGDYRILTVHVTTGEEELTRQIAEAYHQSLVHFGEIIDMLDHIEVWDKGEIKQVDKHTKTPNAAFLGGLLGGLASVFGLLLWIFLEDAVYVERELEELFGLPVVGTRTQKQDQAQEALYRCNLEYLFGNKGMMTWEADRLPGEEDYCRMREAEGLLLSINWGKSSKTAVRHLLAQLKIQDCRVDGLVLDGVNDRFLKMYYGRQS